MNLFPIRIRKSVLLICFFVVPLRSFAQPGDSYMDSLYTYSYLKYRLQACRQQFSIPGPELRRLQAAASIADSLAKRWPGELTGSDAYLPFWVAHPELDEAGARAKFGLTQNVPGNCITDSNGYMAARKRLTALQLSAYKKEQSRDTAATLTILETIGREFPFTSSLFHAKRLAIASRDTAAYLRILKYDSYPNISEARLHELSWPVANSPAKKEFVAAALRLVDSDAMQLPPQEARDVRRFLNRFADLQNIYSECIFAHSAMPPFLRSHKRELRRIYCYLMEESYTVTPGVLCRYINTPDSISRQSLNLLGYLNLHLIQLNAFGQIYPDSLFENYFSFLRQLAYAGIYDMEDCVSIRDEYLTVVKGQPSEFGITTRRKGYELDYEISPSAAVQARREAENLLPLEVASVPEK